MTKKYETETMIINWKPEICKHAAKCVHGAPEVFDTTKKPWIMPENATDEKIREVIDRCPSGALSYEMKK